MSLKRVVLIAAMLALISPGVALADGVTIGFTGSVLGGVTTVGHVALVQPNSGGVVLGSVATNNVGQGDSRVVYVSRFSGSTIPTPPLGAAPNSSLPPQIAPTFGSLAFDNNFFNFGSVVFTTGPAIAYSTGLNSGSVTYDAGGTVVVTGNGGLGIGANPLFTGSFSGPTTVTLLPGYSNTACPSCNFYYDISGPVSGTLDPQLLALLGLGTPSPGANGIFFSFVAGFAGPTDTVGNLEGGSTSLVVPEPGTLALFGTGLLGIAGFIRRRSKA